MSLIWSCAASRFYWLDLLRFVCALIVVLSHTRGIAFVEFGALPASQKQLSIAVIFILTRLGHEAVIIFFVLSGFLVGGRALERMVNGQFRPMDYAIDRFSRIMPPLFSALIFTAIVGLITDNNFNLWHFIGNLFSLQGIFVPCLSGNPPLWSLSYEVWFYVLVWAVGVAALHSSFHFVSALIIFLIGAIFTRLEPIYLFCWLIGAFVYIRRPKKFSVSIFFGALMILLYGIFAVQCGTDSVSIVVGNLRRWVVPFDIAQLFVAIGIGILMQQLILIVPTKPIAIHADLVGTKLAVFSYTLYLTHYPTLKVIRSLSKISRAPTLDIVSIGTFSSLLLACLICAYLIYWCFEKRTPNFRRWLKGILIA